MQTIQPSQANRWALQQNIVNPDLQRFTSFASLPKTQDSFFRRSAEASMHPSVHFGQRGGGIGRIALGLLVFALAGGAIAVKQNPVQNMAACAVDHQNPNLMNKLFEEGPDTAVGKSVQSSTGVNIPVTSIQRDGDVLTCGIPGGEIIGRIQKDPASDKVFVYTPGNPTALGVGYPNGSFYAMTAPPGAKVEGNRAYYEVLGIQKDVPFIETPIGQVDLNTGSVRAKALVVEIPIDALALNVNRSELSPAEQAGFAMLSLQRLFGQVGTVITQNGGAQQ